MRREGVNVVEVRSTDIAAALDEAKLSRFHLRAVLVAGMGFFTDAYDLFIIGIAATLIKQEWHIGTAGVATVNSMTLAASFLGAFVFGRIADLIGRKRVYWLVAVIMVIGAIGSALAPTFWVLVLFRFVLGIGIGGDYPVSAVLISEYSNRKDRGKLVGMVFSTQALGLIVGPLVALALLGGGVSHGLAWRLMLGLGAIPAAAVLYLRKKMPESPRYVEQVQGAGTRAAPRHRMGLKEFLCNRKFLIMLIGTAGTWFLFDYAYYGNTISSPQILKLVAPHASLMTTTALQLLIFTVAALPGYFLAIARMDRIGHKKLQWIGFLAMALCYAIIGFVPGVASTVAPFLIFFGISYFFAEFGPNTTTFVLPAELYPVSMRATGHGISSGVAKLGAFIGVFVFPFLQSSLGLRGTLIVSAAAAAAGAALTMVLPEPSGRSLEELSGAGDVVNAAEQVIAEAGVLA